MKKEIERKLIVSLIIISIILILELFLCTNLIASNKEKTKTTSSNINNSLTTFYSTLDTNRLNGIGILNKSEIEIITHSNYSGSYLYNLSPYYIYDNGSLKEINSTGETTETEESYLRPTVYVKAGLRVRGSGTADNPYVIYEDNRLITKVLADHPEMSSTSSTEDGSTIYYFSGATANNWVAIPGKFSSKTCYFKHFNWDEFFVEKTYEDTIYADYAACNNANDYDENCEYICENYTVNGYAFFRIIRTNTNLEGGGVRLIYVGTGTSSNVTQSTSPNAIASIYPTYDGSFDNMTDLKDVLYSWYSTNMLALNNIINNKAIYCNDNSYDTNGVNEWGSFNYAAKTRIEANKPSLKCGVNANGTLINTSQADKDKYTKSSSTGNGQLTYPVGLITADEVKMMNTNYTESWFRELTDLTDYSGSTSDIIGSLTMTPNENEFDSDSYLYVLEYVANSISFNAGYSGVGYFQVFPVLSLKSNVEALSGDGSSSDPYIVKSQLIDKSISFSLRKIFKICC